MSPSIQRPAIPVGSRSRIASKVWQDWLHDWSVLLDTQMPVLEALQCSIALLGDSRAERVLGRGLALALDQIRQGNTLRDSLLASGLWIPPEVQLAIACGERTGLLAEAVQTHATRWVSRHEGQTSFAKSLVYPVFVLILSFVCWAVLDANVASTIPNQTSFEWQSEDLLIGLSILTLLLLLGLRGRQSLFLRQSVNVANPSSKSHWEQSIPFSSARCWHLSDFFFALGQELSSGLDLLSCLKRPSPKSHRWYPGRQSTLHLLSSTRAELLRCVQAGRGIHNAFKATGAPEIVLRQASMAEHTGDLGHCCLNLARIYEIKAQRIQRRLQTSIPPALLMLAAAVIAMACHTTLLPLYSASGNL